MDKLAYIIAILIVTIIVDELRRNLFDKRFIQRYKGTNGMPKPRVLGMVVLIVGIGTLLTFAIFSLVADDPLKGLARILTVVAIIGMLSIRFLRGDRGRS